MTTHTITTSGTTFTETWRSVAGATSVEVDAAALVLEPPGTVADRNLGAVAGASTEVNSVVVEIPGGTRTIRSLKLTGLSRRDGDTAVEILGSGDLDKRLAVAVVDPGTGNAGAPVHVVPAVPQRGSVPPQLGGASFSGGVLRLPDLRAQKVELTRVRNDFPEEFETQPFSLTSVEATIADHPEELTVNGPDGATLFARPGPFATGAEPATVGLRVPFELALNTALGAGQALTAAFTVSAAVDGRVRTDGIRSEGAVLRAFPEPVMAVLDGRAVPLPVPDPPLDPRVPNSVVADVTIRYRGLRLHALSSPVPASVGGLGGPVVGADAHLAPLPPGALAAARIARLGLVGRPAGDTDLVVRLVRVVGGVAAEPLGDPGVVSLPAADMGGADAASVVWVDLPAPVEITPPVGVTVAATRGAFRWVADPDPLVLIAVVEDDPGGRLVTIGATPIPVDGDSVALPGFALDPASFAGPPPVVASELFCSVHLAKLTVRYAP